MKDIAIEFINIIEESGYKAYIVGGFVRDYLLGISSIDIDITTNATPKDIKKIFSNVNLKKSDYEDSNYGSVLVIYKNIEFEVTTFREESYYLDNRHPSRIKYINDLEKDLLRRDFTINTICMDKNGNIIDLLNGEKDLKKKVIRTILDSTKSFHDDSLRILRAIRFAVTLDFKLDEELIKAIEINGKYLKNISYERKKIELDKIFGSSNAKYGIELIKKMNLEKYLELNNLDRVKDYTDLIGIWAMINSDVYRFTKVEKELIKKINVVYDLDNLDHFILYKYGLYVNVLAGINKGISKKKINLEYKKLPIKSKNDINITAQEICEILERVPGSFINVVYKDLEKEILMNNLKNNKLSLIKFIEKNKEKYFK
ncbi:MAG: hypothetical protein IKN63_02715 [Bacilli bacterium]|nr:hypothetical protein [Bacilli bacterium]